MYEDHHQSGSKRLCKARAYQWFIGKLLLHLFYHRKANLPVVKL
ncbi:hypothetical protein SITYG_10170 [Streptococcus intermedius]|uniref:Uncharacterized protein n=1 Tax=Streptococcus intermedius TaxID=1338 RepID=A0AAD1FJK4_STRIT|nr:hypothetical protein SITYG_10170 [Streptococcus intermedius]